MVFFSTCMLSGLMVRITQPFFSYLPYFCKLTAKFYAYSYIFFYTFVFPILYHFFILYFYYNIFMLYLS